MGTIISLEQVKTRLHIKIPESSKKELSKLDKRYLDMIYQTNLAALDKTLSSIRRALNGIKLNSNQAYSSSAARTASIAVRMIRAVHEVRLTLPRS